ncbi:calpain-10 [Synchiropus picturatus]
MGAESGGVALFEDLDFPANDASLFSDGSTPIARLQGSVVWKRPQEICQSPVLYPEDVSQAHAKQGFLGDCWFLCACSILLKNKHLLHKVFSPDEPFWGDSKYRGSFHFRFWKHGHWREVTIDDTLPCIDSTPCFSRCHSPNAFWVSLLEKAYAKLHGSYERLWAGQVYEAMVDLTGGLAECWSLGDVGSEDRLKPERDRDEVRRRRLDLNLLNSMMDACAISCSTHSNPGVSGCNEPDQHHALSVMEWVDVKKVNGTEVRLLRLKNPWGRCSWGGAWMEGGEGWGSVDHVYALTLQSRLKDGEFWLDINEFLSEFDDVTVGYPISEEGHLQSIYTGGVLKHSQQLAGRWLKGFSSGGSRNSSSYTSNPKFWLKVSEKAEVIVSLLQHRKWTKADESRRTCLEGGRNTTHQRYHAIALHMWKVQKKHFNLSRTVNQPPHASTHCHTYDREVVLPGLLEPGFYLLIPSCYQHGAEANFLIRVFSSSPASLSALKSPAPPLPIAANAEWETQHFRGSWVKGRTAGGSRNFTSHRENPCFPFTVSEDSTGPTGVNIKITLHQGAADSDLLPIGFHVYKVPDGDTSEAWVDPVASCVPHCYTPDVSLSCRLSPGLYHAVPSTYQPDCSSDFTLSIARIINRKVVQSKECLGKAIQEVSSISVMTSQFT